MPILVFILTNSAAIGLAYSPQSHSKRSGLKNEHVAGAAGHTVVTESYRPSHAGAGLATRLGAGVAGHAAKVAVEHVVARPLHEDLHYHRSTRRGFGPRLRHALASTVITTNTRTGKRTPAAGRISGNAAGAAVSHALVPAGSGAATAGVGIAADAGANVAREFWPRDHRRHPKHRRAAQQHLRGQAD